MRDKLESIKGMVLKAIAYGILLVFAIISGFVKLIPTVHPIQRIRIMLKSFLGLYLKNKSNIILTLMFLCLVLLVSVTTFHYSETPEFCLTCHLMKPYYLSYQTSPHKEVESCLECHYEPGTIGHIKGKIGGMISLIRYITGMYTLPIETNASSEMCTRCHEISSLDEVIDYEGVRFQHLHEIAEGDGRCGFCHQQEHGVVPHADCGECHEGIVHGNKTEIGMDLCIECHSKRGVSNRCETCHEGGMT